MFDVNGKDNSTYNVDNFEFIKKTSPIVGGLIEKEYNRQKNNVELIASENYCSEAVLAACGSCLSWKYAEGYPYVRTSGNTSRYYGGTEFVDELEEYCCDMWRKVFDTDYHVNVQPHSGSQANFAAYKAILQPGDTILSLSLDNGGHLTHGSSVNFSGKLYNMVFYDVDERGYIDMQDVRKKALAWQTADDPDRCFCLFQNNRFCGVCGDREGSRCLLCCRYGAYRGTGRWRRASVSVWVCGYHYNHDAQDAQRSARRFDLRKTGAGKKSGQCSVPLRAGRPTRTHHRGKGNLRGRSAAACLQGIYKTGCKELQGFIR